MYRDRVELPAHMEQAVLPYLLSLERDDLGNVDLTSAVELRRQICLRYPKRACIVKLVLSLSSGSVHIDCDKNHYRCLGPLRDRA